MSKIVRGRAKMTMPVLRMAAIALVISLLASGCTTRTAGMQSPLAHDYDGLQWRPLDHLVSQAVIVAPAYTALVENDPATDPATLRARVEELPDDARDSRLVEIRIAARPLDEVIVDTGSLVVVGVLDQTGTLLDARIELPLAALESDGDWLIIDDIPQAAAGETLMISLAPGEGGGAGWEYAFTPGRSPYGGEPAAVGDAGERLSGALGFQTIFAQPTDASALADDVADSVTNSFWRDPLLGLLYAGMLAGIVAVVWFRPSWGRDRANDGR